MTYDELSEDQQVAVDRIQEWRRNAPFSSEEPKLTLAGYAGTGKSAVISHLAKQWENAAVCALFGKAAHVLRRRGVQRAQTIHSLLYETVVDKKTKKVKFKRRKTLPCYEVIVDEAQTVDWVIFQDLMSFRIPVLFVGDHGQLQPIGSDPRLMDVPDLVLDKIHRQAADSPILRLAQAFREGQPTPHWTDPKGRLRVTSRREFERSISPDVQMICGFNKTRHKTNQLVRSMLGHTNVVNEGDKLICLKNDYNWGVFNGQQVTVQEVLEDDGNAVWTNVESDDGTSFMLPCVKEQFGRNLAESAHGGGHYANAAYMDYGWAITTHKAVGSSWGSTLVLDEVAKSWDERRWRYTAATRVAETLVYCL